MDKQITIDSKSGMKSALLQIVHPNISETPTIYNSYLDVLLNIQELEKKLSEDQKEIEEILKEDQKKIYYILERNILSLESIKLTLVSSLQQVADQDIPPK